MYSVKEHGVMAPKLIYKTEPTYTEQARAAALEGMVKLALHVGADGRAHNLEVVQSLGMGLDEKAMEAIRQWRFEPGKKDGEPVVVRATVDTNFRLQ